MKFFDFGNLSMVRNNYRYKHKQGVISEHILMTS